MKVNKISAAVLAAGCFFINNVVQAAAPVDDEVVAHKPGVTVKYKEVKTEEVSKKQEKPAAEKVSVKTKNSKAEKKVPPTKEKTEKNKTQYKLKSSQEQKKTYDKKDLLKVDVKQKFETKQIEKKPVKTEKFRGMDIPADYKKIAIIGDAVATKGQAVNLIKSTTGGDVKLDCSIEEIVGYYWAEAQREGVRPDLALAQALVETGFFRYGGNVKPKQNNFCGLGTTGKGVRGAKFKTPEIGVRAHIQHLLAYAKKERPTTKIEDPRYDLAHSIRLERGMIETWHGLNGTWAMGANYCEKIMVIYQNMLNAEMSEAEKAAKIAQEKLQQKNAEQNEKAVKKAKEEAKKREKERQKAQKEAKKREQERLKAEEKRRKEKERHKMRERVDKILQENKSAKVVKEK